MPKPINFSKFATKKELEQHKKSIEKLIKKSIKEVKKWDVAQDKKLLTKRQKKSK